ncbi:MAG: AI-2E family transporter [Nanoarchaeota archaeon]|nr:AI-2E family transporter [Nanoarchaeota archaeon]
MIDEKMFKKLSIVLVIGALAALSLIILWPLVTSILAGLILAYVFKPVYLKFYSMTKKENLSALIVMIIVFFLVLIPMWIFLPIVAKQVFDVYLDLQKVDTINLVKTIFPSFIGTGVLIEFAASLNNFISSFAGRILTFMSSFILDLPNFLLKISVVFFVFFFAMRDSESLKGYVQSLSPFSSNTEMKFSKRFKDITNAVIFGQIIIGFAQGVVTGIGLFIFGVPNALILTITATLVGILPIIGPWLVWIPVDIYLFAEGRTAAAIGFLIYGLIVISWIDVLIRPMLVSKKTKISSAVVLVGMIGGLIIFGLLGLILGPLILAYLLLFLDAYREKKFPSLFS